MPQKNRIFAISKSQSIRQAPTKFPEEPTLDNDFVSSPAFVPDDGHVVGTAEAMSACSCSIPSLRSLRNRHAESGSSICPSFVTCSARCLLRLCGGVVIRETCYSRGSAASGIPVMLDQRWRKSG